MVERGASANAKADSTSATSIRAVGVAHPPFIVSQHSAAERIGEILGDKRRALALARGSSIEQRATVLPADDLRALGSIQDRNAIYRQLAPPLALQAATAVVAGCADTSQIGCLVTSSCTGYHLPGLDVDLVSKLGLNLSTRRLPITQAGCSGGVLGLATGADYVRTHPEQRALVVSVELCSLAFHPSSEVGNLTSALIFGDGAGAALLESVPLGTGGLQLIDSASCLVPDSREYLGFELTDRGFYPILSRELVSALPAPTASLLRDLVARNGLEVCDLGFWLLHPGGSRVLRGLEEAFGLQRADCRWSWESLREFGNTSSAAIFDVLRRYQEDGSAPGGWGVAIAFGPGVTVEMLLLKRD